MFAFISLVVVITLLMASGGMCFILWLGSIFYQTERIIHDIDDDYVERAQQSGFSAVDDDAMRASLEARIAEVKRREQDRNWEE